mgnify:CR=1 FL=1|jgi:hypothetical protein
MEIKNGIIIDGVLHEAVHQYTCCDLCSLHEKCEEMDYQVCMDLFDCSCFINRGKVTITSCRETPKNVGEIIKNK